MHRGPQGGASRFPACLPALPSRSAGIGGIAGGQPPADGQRFSKILQRRLELPTIVIIRSVLAVVERDIHLGLAIGGIFFEAVTIQQLSALQNAAATARRTGWESTCWLCSVRQRDFLRRVPCHA